MDGSVDGEKGPAYLPLGMPLSTRRLGAFCLFMASCSHQQRHVGPNEKPGNGSKVVVPHLPPVEAGTDVSADASVDAAPPTSTPAVMPDVDYWATPQPIVDRMLEVAELKATDVIYDLGCGDARSLITAAERYGAKGVGFDIDPRVVALARDNVRRHAVESLVRIEQANIFTLDLSGANVIFLYMTPRFNLRLVPQLKKLGRGSRIVSHEFEIPGARPARIVKVPGPPDGPPDEAPAVSSTVHTISLWRVPWKKQPTDWKID